MTVSALGTNWYGGTFFCKDGQKTTPNYCNTYVSLSMASTLASSTKANHSHLQPYLDSNGHQAGATIFVLIDCTTSVTLPMSEQDPIYQAPGVSATSKYQNKGKFESS